MTKPRRYISGTGGNWSSQQFEFADGSDLDPFGRLRISEAESRFDSQFTHDLHPLLYQQVTAETGATIAHDATNRCATLAFSSTPTNGKAYMQSYEWFRYQPGNGQLAMVTFNFIEHKANVTKVVGYGDLANNGVHFLTDGATLYWRILSNSGVGDQSVPQSSWNIDSLDGTGPSQLTLDITKTQIAIIDMQALYVGRVRVGFDINGVAVYCHEFNHANIQATPYIQTASLPIICGMTCSGTATTTMRFICATVKSEGSAHNPSSYSFSAEGTATAGSDARTHVLSLRPKTTFNSIANRTKFQLGSIEAVVTGANPVLVELVIGQAISGTTTYTDANAAYSAFEYNTAGTISGSPTIVVAATYLAAAATARSSISTQVANRYPITLDVDGAVRALGTISIIATGIGGASAMRASMNWTEAR